MTCIGDPCYAKKKHLNFSIWLKLNLKVCQQSRVEGMEKRNTRNLANVYKKRLIIKRDSSPKSDPH